MLLVNVHQLDIVLADPVAGLIFEDQIDHVGRVLRLDGEHVFVLSRTKHFCERAKVDSQGNVTIAAEGRECLGP